ncbi:MAG: ATP-grasp domain-containing protein [Deltaproteobacteria bacterium]|nr:ATP-grasp domain-containing protein [Deltaproteobacteria bacterium]
MARRLETLLIANRGEIARRIIRTCRAMGIRPVAVYSDADRDLPHVREADQAFRLGAGPADESYLNMERLLKAARDGGADAVHPGYGFLAENPAFSAACTQAGLIFVGPPPGVMEAMGDKARAKRLMESAGVPVLPGVELFGDDDGRSHPANLASEAERIGYPLLLKAQAGGGGRGIRLVRKPEELPEAFASARREALGSFADGRIMLEKYLENPRHVEFQIFRDEQGHTLHLFERECSIQRRHQKLVEESPSPALGLPGKPGRREEMSEAALLAARTADYVGAGTVEFLLDQGGRFYFLEMNTRLQVEHPVTEELLGLDLVRLQLEIAQGLPLAIRQEELVPQGHAIECRLNAEDPFRGFLPGTGTLLALETPAGPNLRTDAGYEAGNLVGSHYDSLLAKLIVHGENRSEALRLMGDLLRATRVAGVCTNLSYLAAIVGSADFSRGEYHTGFIGLHEAELTGEVLDEGLRNQALLALAGLTAHGMMAGQPPLLRPETAIPGVEPLTGRLQCRIRLGDETILADWRVYPRQGGLLVRAEWDGREREAVFIGQGACAATLETGGLVLPLWWKMAGDECWLDIDGRHLHLRIEDPANEAERTGDDEAAQKLRAPLPGRITKVAAEVDDRVSKGQVLLVLEAMKMEHSITAPFAGRLVSLPFREGAQVERDDQLAEIEAE